MIVRRVLIFDVETTGLDRQGDAIIEIACALWSVEHHALVECHSTLLAAPFSNGGIGVNGLADELLASEGRVDDVDRSIGWAMIADSARRADAVVAHFAEFDRSFVWAWPNPNDVSSLVALPWICTAEDMVWPVKSSRRSLVSLALAHDVAVTASHRAMNDCLTLVRLLERVPDVGQRLDYALYRALRPKADFFAQIPFERNDEVKAAGFKWNGRAWHRYMAIEEAEALPFTVMRAAKQQDTVQEAAS